METIRLQFESNLKERIMTFLETLPSKEVEITIENTQFKKDKLEIHKQYNAYKNSDCKVYSIEEVEAMFEKDTI